MASHAGMEYVLKTRYGYVNKDGNFVTDIKEALEINFIRFGFGPSAYQVYERLGFDKSKITEDDIKFYVTKPSYDSRISQIGSILSEIGYDFENVIFKSSSAFSFYHLDNYDNFISYMEELNKKLRKFYEGKEVDKTISYKDKKIKLWIVDENKNREYCNISYYSDLGKIMEYSFNLKKLNRSKYFDLSIEEKEYYDNFQNNGLWLRRLWGFRRQQVPLQRIRTCFSFGRAQRCLRIQWASRQLWFGA